MNRRNENASEAEVQGQKPKTCKLAVASLVLPGLFMAFWLPMTIGLFDVMVVVSVCVLGFVLGVVAIVRIDKSNGKLTGRIFAMPGIVISVVLIPLILMGFYSSQNWQKLARRVACGANLRGLYTALMIYGFDNDDQYPPAEKWCDLLVQYADVEEKQFRCPGNKQERCSYAMNPNCEPNSPADMVLLFETKGGWNQFGGAELLTTENHNGDGCNILFNDGSVSFEKTGGLDELMWDDKMLFPQRALTN